MSGYGGSDEKILNGEIEDGKKLEFVIFCIENIALRTGVSGEKIYSALAKKSDILSRYIIPCYDILHTQDKDYIIDDILGVMKRKGVEV